MRVDNIIATTPKVLDFNRVEPTDKSHGFKDILMNIISETRNLRETDLNNNNLLATGNGDSLDRVMIDMEKADIALQFTLQIRNKILDAYQEIMRMQI